MIVIYDHKTFIVQATGACSALAVHIALSLSLCKDGPWSPLHPYLLERAY